VDINRVFRVIEICSYGGNFSGGSIQVSLLHIGRQRGPALPVLKAESDWITAVKI
jgi:hypothetical protein